MVQKTHFCKLCRCTIQRRRPSLTKHENSEKHTRRLRDQSSLRPLPVVRFCRGDHEVKRAEIELAASISCHSANAMIDRLGEVLARNAEGSKLEKIKLHKTKHSKIITKAIAPAIKEE